MNKNGISLKERIKASRTLIIHSNTNARAVSILILVIDSDEKNEYCRLGLFYRVCRCSETISVRYFEVSGFYSFDE
jgi:hypothetical protein